MPEISPACPRRLAPKPYEKCGPVIHGKFSGNAELNPVAFYQFTRDPPKGGPYLPKTSEIKSRSLGKSGEDNRSVLA
jgi:hypothetical protein